MTYDVLILGSGIAGLSTALAAAPRRVAVLTRGQLGEDGASRWAQGGIAAALGDDDSPALHARDTLAAGLQRNDADAVARLTGAAAAAVAWLERLGACFDRDEGGQLRLGREAAHARARIVHAQGDASGAEVMRCLRAAALAAPHITRLEQHEARQLLCQDGRVVGVRLAEGGVERARHVVSAMGALNTVQALPAGLAPDWRDALRRHLPSHAYITLYLGLEGSAEALRALGLDGANHWIYDGQALGCAPDPEALLWQSPTDTDAPALYVSFGGLNDPEQAHAPTAEVIALCDWRFFATWRDSSLGQRPPDYEATKAWIEDRLLSQFKRLFPALKNRIAYHELSTPLTQAAYALAPEGAMYGLACTPARLLDPALHVRTPVPGLLLAGQDVASLGIEGAAMGGFMAAATLKPALWKLMKP